MAEELGFKGWFSTPPHLFSSFFSYWVARSQYRTSMLVKAKAFGLLVFGREEWYSKMEGCWILRALLQRGPLGKELVVKAEAMEASKAMEACCISVGKELSFVSLPNKFANLNRFLELPVASFEKEISTLLRKMESRKDCRVKVTGGKRKIFSSTHLDCEIRKLECSVNYNLQVLSSLSQGKGQEQWVSSSFNMSSLLCS